MQWNVPTIIIEPFVLSREGLRRILVEARFQVVWCSDAPPTAPICGLAAGVAPLVIISTGLDEAIVHISEVRQHYPNARIALLMEPVWQQQSLLALRRCCVDTVMPRDISYEAFIGTLRLVLEGSTVLPSQVASLLLNDPEEPEPSSDSGTPLRLNGQEPANDEILPDGLTYHEAQLSPVVLQQEFGLSLREMGVLEGLREGRSNKEIARGLGITEATVKVHVKAILRKARVRNRTQVAMWASRHGLGQAQVGIQLNGMREGLLAGSD